MAILRYEGDQPCPGCGTPGTIKARTGKNDLCEDCKRLLQIGKEAKKFEEAVSYSIFHVTRYAFWRNDLDEAVFEFLKEISNESASPRGPSFHLFRDGVISPRTYRIPTLIAEPLEKFLNCIADIGRQFYRYEDKLAEENEEILNEERNKIFNEGVEYGRNLLFQLNRGELTAADISKEIKKY